MKPIKILIPTDFSVQAEYAYLLVNNIRAKINAEVHFVHVFDVPDTVSLDSKGNIQTCGEIDVEYLVSQKQIIDRKLNDMKKLYGEDIQTHLLFGKLTDTILEFSETEKFDLIVMGTKGVSGLKEKLVGSETQIIVRKSKIPVLSMMCDRSDLVIKNILLVHDFSSPVKEDLDLLKMFVDAYGAKVHQLQITSDTTKEYSQILSNMNAYAEVNGIVGQENHVLADSDVENGVIHFNQIHTVDLVCIGTHGKGSLFHSSATEKLVNHMYKPIITYHIN